MQYNKLTPLGWDSRFFGYPVAQIIFNQSGIEKLESFFQEIKEERIRLTYLFVSPSDNEINELIEKKGGILVDQKTIFTKTTEPHAGFKNNIIEYRDSKPNEQLIDLGLQAGLFSRFKTDKNFVNKEFEKLYIQWLLNSVNKTIAFATFVALFENDIIGITTLGKKDKYADIGLVAVDSNFNGKGIGAELINYADNTAFTLKYEVIKVVTQLQNTRACRLYEKCNFKIENITNIYHFWQ